ncbi:MAG: hypothetical protein V3V18_04730 [Methylococcales bacterium]
MIAKGNYLSAIVFTLASITASLSFADTGIDENGNTWTTVPNEIEFEPFRTSAWEEVGKFEGLNTRLFNKSKIDLPWLYLVLDQDNGGWDATIGKIVSTGFNLEEGDRDKFFNKTLTFEAVNGPAEGDKLTGDGIWWYGAKVAITTNKQFEAGNLFDNWECYIVENSELDPWDLMNRFDWLESKGWSQHGGANYQHFAGDLSVIINEGQVNEEARIIHQVFAVRWDDQRESGTIHVGRILDHWKHLDIVENKELFKLQENRPLHSQGWLLYFETQGETRGRFYFQNLVLPDNDNL